MAERFDTTELCSYGCGQEAKYKFKNGKLCCRESQKSCPAIRKKISEAKSGEKNPNYGKHRSTETKQKISEAKKGKKASAETRQKMGKSKKGENNPMSGKHHTAKARQLMSEAKTGEKNPMSGKHHSAGTRKLQSESRIKYLQSPEADTHCSKSSQQFCWKLHKIAKDRFKNIYFAELNHEHSASTTYLYDFTILDTKKVIEFHGDFWHANPNIYEAEEKIVGEMSAGERWTKDRKKIEAAEQKGFEVLVVWESDYKRNPEKVVRDSLNFLLGE